VTPGEMRAMAKALPDVIERDTWGKPTFRVRDKLFATLAPDGSSATLKSSPEEQQALVAADAATFTIAAYMGRHGWVTARLDRVDKTQMEELVLDAWHRAVPRQLAAPISAHASPPR
jgi:hypothetical protein